ncbi:MAG: secretin N-terminal domain-containing protein [Candidatus Omnitrophota bacterium]
MKKLIRINADKFIRVALCAALLTPLSPFASFAEDKVIIDNAQAEVAVHSDVPPAEEIQAGPISEPAQEALTNQPGIEDKAEEAEEKKDMTPEELLNQPISLDLRNIDVLEALKYLATKGSLNIVSTKNVSGRVTLTLNNVPLKDVFDLMLRSNGLAYIKIGDIYNVMSEAEYKALYGKNFYDLRKVKVLRLKYAAPEQMFTLLDALKSEIGRVLVESESGNILIMDTPDRIIEMETALEQFEKQGSVEIFVLKYAKAKDVEEILKTRLDTKKVGTVKADERNNQLLIQAFPDRMQEIRRLIAELDKPTKQVLIDTKIVKIKLTDQMDTGVQWEGLFDIAKELGTTYLGSYPFSNIPAGSSSPAFTTRTNVLNSLGGQIGSYPFSGTTTNLAASVKTVLGENMHVGIVDSNRDFDVLMNYLNTITTTRLISSPKLLVVNNQEAKIHVGERQAYVTTTTTQGQTTSTIAEEVVFVDIGIQFSVTATINDDGFITMKVRPEISSVASTLVTPTNNRIPIIDTSLAETTVMMKDGTTLLIGGLRREEKVGDTKGTPGISKIPFLGALAKTDTQKTERTELLIAITPHIVSGVNMDVGNDRYLGDKAGKGYEEYQAVTPRKDMLPQAQQPAINPKSYRDYTALQEAPDNELLIKGHRYEPK